MKVLKGQKTKPLVSIVIPYDRDRGYLKDAIKSARNQTHPNCEVIQSCSPNSLGYNVNKGVSIASGEFIKILAEDDLLFNDSITNLINGMGDNDFVCANALNQVYGGSDFLFRSAPVGLKEQLFCNRIHGGTPLYKRSLWEELGGWDEDLKTAEEYDWHLKLLHNGKKLGYVDKTVTIYRIWGQGKGSTKASDPERKKQIKTLMNERYGEDI